MSWFLATMAARASRSDLLALITRPGRDPFPEVVAPFLPARNIALMTRLFTTRPILAGLPSAFVSIEGVDYDRSHVNCSTGNRRRLRHSPSWVCADALVDVRRITQSLAILVYLTAYPDPRLMPADPFVAAVRRGVTIACDIHPLNNLRVLKYLKGELGQHQEAIDRWYAHWVSEGFAALELLAAPRAGSYLFGDAPTLADVCLVPQMFNARRFNVPVDAFPTLVRADENARALAPFARAPISSPLRFLTFP